MILLLHQFTLTILNIKHQTYSISGRTDGLDVCHFPQLNIAYLPNQTSLL